MPNPRYIEQAERWLGDADSKDSAQIMATLAIAEQLERIATHLGNIHQCLMTPDANHEPVTVADQLKRIAASLGETQHVAHLNGQPTAAISAASE